MSMSMSMLLYMFHVVSQGRACGIRLLVEPANSIRDAICANEARQTHIG